MYGVSLCLQVLKEKSAFWNVRARGNNVPRHRIDLDPRKNFQKVKLKFFVQPLALDPKVALGFVTRVSFLAPKIFSRIFTIPGQFDHGESICLKNQCPQMLPSGRKLENKIYSKTWNFPKNFWIFWNFKIRPKYFPQILLSPKFGSKNYYSVITVRGQLDHDESKCFKNPCPQILFSCRKMKNTQKYRKIHEN